MCEPKPPPLNDSRLIILITRASNKPSGEVTFQFEQEWKKLFATFFMAPAKRESENYAQTATELFRLFPSARFAANLYECHYVK